MTRHVLALLILSATSGAAVAQSNISAANKHAWGENIGFLNWRDAGSPAGAQGVVVRHAHLSGFVWAENGGWIRLGADGAATNCGQYPPAAAQTGAAYGVNIDGWAGGGGVATVGLLSGFGWGENLGWINFGTAHPSRPSDQWARYDRAARRLRGFAWSEQAGWINLDSSVLFVAADPLCADADGNGVVEPGDVALFVQVWFCSLTSGSGVGDFDSDGAVAPADVAMFVQRWFASLTTGSCS